MALRTIIKTDIDGSLTLTDATAVTPLSLVVQFTKGDISLSGVEGPVLNSSVAIECRGKLASVRNSARAYPQISFTALVAEFSEDTVGTVFNAMQQSGIIWSAALSTLQEAGLGDRYTLNSQFIMALVGNETGDPSEFTLGHVDWSWDFSESTDGNTISATGIVYGDITGDIVAAELA